MRQFLKDTSGNIAMITAFVLTVIMVAITSGMDMVMMTSQSKALQDYADSALLAAAISGDEDEDDLQDTVDRTILAHNVNGWVINAEISILDDVLHLEASMPYESFLMASMGLPERNLSAIAEAPVAGAAPLNIALVLDRTESMEGDNMDDLKDAAVELVDALEATGNPDIRMSLVPFSQYVNVGIANRGASWMNVPADHEASWDKAIYDYDHASCRETDKLEDGKVVGVTTVCDSEAITHYEPTAYDRRWRGCAGSRDGVLNTVAEYGSDKMPGVMHEWCGDGDPDDGVDENVLIPLTDSYDNIRSGINAMWTSGETYLPAGLIWGWRTLNRELPYDEAASLPGDERINAIILMTDGANSKSVGSSSTNANPPNHDGTDVDAADDLTEELCEAIKDDGIQVYTIAYRLDDDVTSTNIGNTKKMLEDCATRKDNNFSANRAEELSEAFESISRKVFQVRLSK